MITISINPVAFTIGDFSVRWYGVMVALGAALGIWVYSKFQRFPSLDTLPI